VSEDGGICPVTFNRAPEMGIENRKHPRRHVEQFGVILNRDRSVLGRCTMLDASATGAQLSVKTTSELPNQFTLVLSKNGRVFRRCQVVWRNGDIVGVRFLAALSPHQPSVHEQATS
jgi:hypothetical protein